MDLSMKRSEFLRHVVLGAAAFAAAVGLFGKPGYSGKPNILFILIDDLGWKDTGFMGSKYYETPNIDRLASRGMVFTNAYTCAPNCAPTRGCLMSGQYTPRHGIFTVSSSERGPANARKLIPIPNNRILSSDIMTIAESLKTRGYTSASIGKWHLGTDPTNGPIAQGFDVNVGGTEFGFPITYFSPYNKRINKALKNGPDGEYLTDRLTDEAIRFIADNKTNPFFLYLPHFAVHVPLQARRRMIQKYREKSGHNGQNNPVYAAMIESVDDGIGRITATLDKLGLTQDTIIVFYSDNGSVGGYHRLGINNVEFTSNLPLRGGKGMLYEGGIRVPMFVCWPGKVKGGTVCSEPVTSVDFYPTLLDVTGASKPAGQVLDGESLVPLLNEQKSALDRKAIFWHVPVYLDAIPVYKEGDETGLGTIRLPADSSLNDIWRLTPAGAVRKGNWKLIEFFEDERLELYNLEDDIGENHDLAKDFPEKVKELHTELEVWRKSVGTVVPTEKNPEYVEPD